jgi:hypothetical protein
VRLAWRSRRGWRKRTGTETATETAAAADARTETDEEPRSFRTWLLLYSLSGLSALALEILWFRILDVALKSTAFTFGTLLTVYLLGSGTGALVGVARVRRLRRPLHTFLALQCALLLYAGGMLAVVTRLPADTPYFHWFYEVWGGTRSFNLGGAMYWARAFNLYVVLPLVLFGPPTVLMGLSFRSCRRPSRTTPRPAAGRPECCKRRTLPAVSWAASWSGSSPSPLSALRARCARSSSWASSSPASG